MDLSFEDKQDGLKLSHVICLLKLQRDKLCNEIRILKESRYAAVNDPKGFLSKLLTKSFPPFPPPSLPIPELPSINWDRYLVPDHRVHRSSSIDIVPVKQKERIPLPKSFHSSRQDSSFRKGSVKVESSSDPPTTTTTTTTTTITNTNTNTTITAKTSSDLVNELPSEGNIIRGRVFTKGKPVTFNKLWTVEEQKRLEELLMIYPDEEIATHRWSKIAKALGNRTPRQVASRTQKYFIKLAKEGRPVPGRLPNLELYLAQTKKKHSKSNGLPRRAKRRRVILDSSYYTAPPVYMSDEEENDRQGEKQEEISPREESTNGNQHETKINDTNGKQPEYRSKNESLSPPVKMLSVFTVDEEKLLSTELGPLDAAIKESEEYKELLELMRLQHEQIKKTNQSQRKEIFIKKTDEAFIHLGYKCNSCGMEPITGTRWRCNECSIEVETPSKEITLSITETQSLQQSPPQSHAVDLCDSCKLKAQDNKIFVAKNHCPEHSFERIDYPEPVPYYFDCYANQDSLSGKEDTSNYLLPNYFPS